jgi:HSP20 family protein
MTMTTETNIRKRENNAPEKLAQRATVAPAVDIFENKDELLIFADLPGVAKEDLSINFDKGHLNLSARLREFGPDEEPFDYRRSFVIPQGIDAEKIAANLENGVLRLVLPKPAAMKPRQIEVKAG